MPRASAAADAQVGRRQPGSSCHRALWVQRLVVLSNELMCWCGVLKAIARELTSTVAMCQALSQPTHAKVVKCNRVVAWRGQADLVMLSGGQSLQPPTMSFQRTRFAPQDRAYFGT